MTPREDQLMALIRTRGYWKVIIRPAAFAEHRLERLELFPLMSDASVQLRGWDFPHIDSNEQPHIDAEWAGQVVDWEHSLELWRLYRSGQFLSIAGIFSEWRDRSNFWPPNPGWAPNAVLGINETVARITEVFELAARLSQTKAGDGSMVVAVTFLNVANRILVTDSPNRMPLRGGYRSAVESIDVTRTVARAELIGRTRALAGESSEEVFSYFGWKPAGQIVSDVQREIFDRR
jgi:hypothetical protein